MLVLLVTYFLKAFLYMVMPYFSCCIPRRSNRMRQDPHKMVKNKHKCFMIIHHGIDSISMDISMQRKVGYDGLSGTRKIGPSYAKSVKCI